MQKRMAEKKTRFFNCDHYALNNILGFFICDDNFF